MIKFFLLLVLLYIPSNGDLTKDYSCDVIELNTIWGIDRSLFKPEYVRVLRQKIYWGWDKKTGDLRVLSWRIVRDEQESSFILINGFKYEIFNLNGVVYKIRYLNYRETNTNYDPEKEDREKRKEDERPKWFK